MSAPPTAGLRFAATSPLQAGWWFADRLAPGSAAPNLCRAYRVVGTLDLDILAEAWHYVRRRHAALRTTVREVGGQPVQRIAPAPERVVPLPLSDLAGGVERPEAERVRLLDRWCGDHAGAGFALSAGPPVRFAVARLGADDHGLLLVLHQVIADERSLSVVTDDLAARYAELVVGTVPGAPGGPDLDAYARYAQGQRDLLQRPAARRRAVRRAAALAGVPARLELPVDLAAPSAQWPAAGVTRLGGGVAAVPGLLRLAVAAGTTPNVVLLTGFLTLLHRHTGASQVTAAVPAVVLPGPRAGRLVGACTNLVPVVGDFTGRPAFRLAVRRVARALRTAVAYRDVPLSELVRVLDPPRDPRRTPLCDAVFVSRRVERPPRLPGSLVHRWAADTGATTADLILTVDQVGPTVAGSLRYRTAVCDAATAERLWGQLQILLGAVAVDPDIRVDRLPLERAADLRAAVCAADRIAAGPPVGTPVPEQVRERAGERPDAVAVDAADDRLTYSRLQRTAGAIAAALRRGGPVDGEPVAVRMPPGALQVATVLGVFQAGARLVALDANDLGERGRSVLAGLRPARLVVGGAAVDDAVTRWFADQLGGRVVEAAAAASGGPARGTTLGGPQWPAYIAYTSGSTGRPKGIPQSHAALAQFTGWFADAFRIGPGSRVAQWAAPSYDASLCEVFAALIAGATCCVAPERIRAHPERMLDWLADQRITVLQTVPSFARELLAAATRRGSTTGLAGLDHLLLAGEALPGRLADAIRAALPGVRLINLYGATESILATWHEVTESYPAMVPVGTSIPGRQVLVLDDHDRPCPTGVTGRIVVHSPYVTAGYVGSEVAHPQAFRPVQRAATFSPHDGRWHRTGDLGRRRWDGALEFRGRDDQQIKFNGVRLELTELEAVLGAQPTVTDCAVVAVAGPDARVARLVAYVVTPEPAGAGHGWRAAVRQHLGRLTVPLLFRTVPALPRNAGGKVDRAALSDPGVAGPPAEPGSPVPRALAAVFAEVLGAPPRDPWQTFTAAGGHSLLVPVLLHRIRQRHGVDVPVAEFWADPTLAGLATAVENSAPSFAARAAAASAPHERAAPSAGTDRPSNVRVAGGSPP